jgi:hypothetical protein
MRPRASSPRPELTQSWHASRWRSHGELAESETNGGYSLEAEPVQAGDACGIFSLDATGARSNRLDEALAPSTVAACWGQR